MRQQLFFRKDLKMIFFTYMKRWFDKNSFCGNGGYAEIWKIAWPFIILNAANTIMMVTNRIFLAKYSSSAIAAAMPAGQLYFTFVILFLVTTGFTATVVAQYYGADDKINCIRAAWNGFFFSVGISFLLSLTFPLAGPFIFARNGHDPMIAALEAEYFSAMTACAGFTCLETPLFSFFTGRGKTKILAIVKGLGCILSIPLNYLLIYGKSGFPELGILGAGLANSIANACTFLTVLICFFSVDQNEYATRKYRELRWELFRKLLVFGTPAGFQAFLRNACFALVVMMIGILGNEALMAASVALCINMVGNMPIFGMSDATGILTGQYIGKKDLKTASKIFWQALRMLLPWLISIAGLYVFTPNLLIGLFGSNDTSDGIDIAETLRIVRFILLMAAIFNFFDAIRFLLMGALRGAGDTKIPLLIGVGTSWGVLLPGTAILVLILKCQAEAVWIVMTVYIALDALLMLWRRGTGAWKKIKIID